MARQPAESFRMLHRFLVGALLAFSAVFANAAERSQVTLTVFAAASLTDALQKVTDEFTRSSGIPVRLSFAASSALAKQIEIGARADVFFSADQDWMDYVQERDLVDRSTRVELLGNRLALVAPIDSQVSIELANGAPIAEALGRSGRLAVGDPDSVPAGRYAKGALTSLGLWPQVERRLARAENVRVALLYVARGEAPLGIVYSTDARIEPRVKIVALFPEDTHPPITYPVAATAHAQPEARQYLAYLRSEAAKRIFTEAGFELPSASHSH